MCVAVRQKAEQLKKESILRHKKEYMMIRQRTELSQLMQSGHGEHHINFDVCYSRGLCVHFVFFFAARYYAYGDYATTVR